MFLNLVILFITVIALILIWGRHQAFKPLHPDYRIKEMKSLDSYCIERFTGDSGWSLWAHEGTFFHKTYYDARCYLREYLNKQD